MPDSYGKTKQVLLAAIGVGTTDAVMGYRGSGVAAALQGEGTGLENPADHFPLKGYPGTPGLYVWRGDAILHWRQGPECINDYDYDWELKGEWSPATGEDLAALMGITDPPTEEITEDQNA